jgi:Protein of unknown function (DUF5818)
MKRVLLTTLMMLLCGTWALAQQDYGQSGKSSSSGEAAIKGCLNKSDSGFTLTDKSGTTYQLTGDTSKLSDHVGHEVQIKGTKAESSAAASTSAGSQQPQLQVSSMKHISETCSSGSSSGHEKSSEKPPMTEKPPKQ